MWKCIALFIVLNVRYYLESHNFLLWCSLDSLQQKERKKDNLGVATGMNCGLASFQVAFDIK